MECKWTEEKKWDYELKNNTGVCLAASAGNWNGSEKVHKALAQA